MSSIDKRKLLIDELLNQQKLEQLLRDSFANYVVQTALEYCNPQQRLIVIKLIVD